MGLPDDPTEPLSKNRWALVDDDGDFDTNVPDGKGPRRSYTVADTAGCNAEQIADALALGKGHYKFGLSISAVDEWLALMNQCLTGLGQGAKTGAPTMRGLPSYIGLPLRRRKCSCCEVHPGALPTRRAP